jgi:SpoVK/Ycf46/Vps4 family AAA+-type ATPase
MNEPKDDGPMKIVSETVRETPTIKDLVGKPKDFAEEFTDNLGKDGIYEMMGVEPDKAFLLYGPPATGKTMVLSAIYNTMNAKLAKIIKQRVGAGEDVDLKVTDFPLLYFTYDIGKFGTAYINMSSRRVQQFFDKVGMYAQMGTQVLVGLDECDALLNSRTSKVQSHSEDRKTLETIMKNLQHAHDTPNMYVVMMTNLPEICDNASLRAGRIDRRIKFDLPEEEQRLSAYQHFIKDLNDKAAYTVIRGAKPEQLAELSEGFNYADIKSVVYGAVKLKASQIARNSAQEIMPVGYVTQKGLMDSLNRQREEFHKCKKQQTRIGFA